MFFAPPSSASPLHRNSPILRSSPSDSRAREPPTKSPNYRLTPSTAPARNQPVFGRFKALSKSTFKHPTFCLTGTGLSRPPLRAKRLQTTQKTPDMKELKEEEGSPFLPYFLHLTHSFLGFFFTEKEVKEVKRQNQKREHTLTYRVYMGASPFTSFFGIFTE